MSHIVYEAEDAEPFVRSDGAKRIFDVAGALAALALTAPVMAAIWIVLALGPGPALFAQVRIGEGGRRFACLKFRTMVRGAEFAPPCAAAEWGERQKLANDPRVTRFGRALRRWGLDETPQLFNVLRGEMSLVGPRPIIPPETPGYPADAAYARSAAFAAYASLRPGITGLWQVSGGAETPHAERVRLDLEYARRRNVWLDLRIVLATPAALIRRKYG